MKNPVKFGKYYLLERINVGGMAEVFKAKSFGEAGFERLVAVKRILPSIAEDQEFISMFIDEAKLAVQLTHPNIAQIFELGKVGEAYFIALEYVPGKDLRAMFDRARKRSEPLPIPMACYMTMKICEGLDYAHNKKDAAGRNLELVHRDVSPQNMLMSWDGDVKLIDFGIAKAASKSSKTQAGILKGKFGYMSPEQVRGLQIDRRSDIFSVGIVLYELLTMERLFIGESDFSTLEKVRNVEIMPPSTYNRKIPEELEQIVLKALAKHPEDRYRTSMDLHDDLQSFMYTSGNFFARKDLSAYMHKVFQDEMAKEASKDEEFRKFDSRRASDLEVFDGATPPPSSQLSASRPGPPPPPAVAPRVSVPPPPPPQARKQTMMGVGFSPPVQGGAPRGGGGAAVAVAAVATPSAPPRPPPPVPAPAQGAPMLDMDWDEEELATQVYDRPDGAAMRGGTLPPPGMPANGHSGPPGVRASHGPAAYAPPRAPTMQMPAPQAPAPKSLPPIPMPAGMSMPSPALAATIAQPAVAAPFPPTAAQQQVSSPFGGGLGYPAPPAVGPPGQGGYGLGGVSAPPPNAAMGGYRADPQQATAIAEYPSERKRPTALIFIIVGIVVVAAGVAAALKFFRGDPTGTLDVTTNVPGVMLLVDDQPQPGNGSHFAVPGLAASTVHRVEVRRDGYLTFTQSVPVHSAQVTPMQVALIPDPAVLARAAAAAQPVPPAPLVALAAPVAPPAVVAEAAPPAATPAPAAAPAPAPAATQTNNTTTTRSNNSSGGGTQHASNGGGGGGSSATRTRTTSTRSNGSRTSNSNARTTSTSSGSGSASTNGGGNGNGGNSTASNGGGGGSGPGTLSISTRPASQCTVGGQTFSTPRLHLQLPAGAYRVQCQNSDFNVNATFNVTIRAGQETREVGHVLN